MIRVLRVVRLAVVAMTCLSTSSTAASSDDNVTFNADDVIAGVQFDEKRCADPQTTVRVEVDGKPDCLRLFGNFTAGASKRPLVFLEGDVVESGSRRGGDVKVASYYLQLSPARYQAVAEQWVTTLARPVVVLGRPGVFGSSGDHLERRRPREVALVDAALSVLKARLGWNRIDLAGFSGGGHLVAALLARRSDFGCAVVASGNVAVKVRLAAISRPTEVDVTGFTDSIDPIDGVAEIAIHPPERLIVLSDPADKVVPIASQQAFVDAARKAGILVEHRLTLAFDPRRHNLAMMAIVAAAGCQ